MVKLLKDVLIKLVLSRLITGASCFETHLLLAFHKARRRNGNLTAGKCASCMREEGWRGHITEPCRQNQISVDRNRVIFSFRYSILKFII